MVVVVSVVAMFDVVVVLGAVCGIIVPENQRVILVAVIGYKKLKQILILNNSNNLTGVSAVIGCPITLCYKRRQACQNRVLQIAVREGRVTIGSMKPNTPTASSCNTPVLAIN